MKVVIHHDFLFTGFWSIGFPSQEILYNAIVSYLFYPSYLVVLFLTEKYFFSLRIVDIF
jgi:hypothetical protein